MVKRLSLSPDSGDDLRSTEGTTTAYAECAAVDFDDHVRAYVSGMTSDTAHDDIGEQTRDVLRKIEGALADLGGTMADVVRVRVYVEEPHLTQENFEAIHDARNDFFSGELPASTLVGVSKLIREGRHVEIDADAVIVRAE